MHHLMTVIGSPRVGLIELENDGESVYARESPVSSMLNPMPRLAVCVIVPSRMVEATSYARAER